MGMYGPGKGISASAVPYRRTAPAWLKVTSRDLVKKVVELARKGMMPSMIALTLRDSMGVGQIKSVTGRRIVRILKAHARAPGGPVLPDPPRGLDAQAPGAPPQGHGHEVPP